MSTNNDGIDNLNSPATTFHWLIGITGIFVGGFGHKNAGDWKAEESIGTFEVVSD